MKSEKHRHREPLNFRSKVSLGQKVSLRLLKIGTTYLRDCSLISKWHFRGLSRILKIKYWDWRWMEEWKGWTILRRIWVQNSLHSHPTHQNRYKSSQRQEFRDQERAIEEESQLRLMRLLIILRSIELHLTIIKSEWQTLTSSSILIWYHLKIKCPRLR